MLPDWDNAQKTEVAVMIMLPIRNTSFLPLISASFPRGTRKTADDRRNAMDTQLIPTAPIEKSWLMLGSAILMAAPRNGLMKEVMMISSRISFLGVLSCPVICLLELQTSTTYFAISGITVMFGVAASFALF